MGDFCFSIDEERYDDRHGHVLSLDGWYSHPDRKTYGFELLGDGYDTVELPEIQRRERPDVAQALGCEFGDFLPGFTVQIPEVLKLAEKYQSLELFLRDGEERVSIWEISADELDELIKENLVEYHLDRVEILYDTMLEIQGWVVDQRGSVEVTVHQEDASLLTAGSAEDADRMWSREGILMRNIRRRRSDSGSLRRFRRSKAERSFFISVVILSPKHIRLTSRNFGNKINQKDS